MTWDLSADDVVRKSPIGDDFTSGGTFVNTNDVASYQIWRTAGSEDPAVIATVPAGEMSYVDPDVENGVEYIYAVTAMDAGGNASTPVASAGISFGPAGTVEPELPPGSEPLAQTASMEFSVPFDTRLLVVTSSTYLNFVHDFELFVSEVLGIPLARIHVTGVVAGSTIITFDILEDATNPNAESSVDAMARLDEEVLADPGLFADAGLGSLLSYESTQTTKIDFGQVQAGADGSTTISFTNTSTDPEAILIVSTSIEGKGFFAFPTKLTLRSGESGSIDISFAAADVDNVNGVYTGTLTVTTNDPNSSPMVIELLATVVGGAEGAVADVSTTSIKFPRTTVNSFASRDLVISNKGGLALSITVSISSSDAISLSDEGTFSLAAGESKTIEVVFAPAEAIEYSATITVATDDPAHPQFAITASGAGVSEGGPARLLDSNGNEIFGDFDGNAKVEFEDFFQFADNFGLTSASANWNPDFDLDGDGAVKFEDFFIFADNFGRSGTYESTGSAAISFAAALDGSQEVPDTGAAGTGFGDFSYTDAGGLTYDITVEGLTGAITVAHIHSGALGVSGSPVHPLTFVEGPTGVWTSSGTWDSSNGLTSALVAELKAGSLYVNVHTALHPSGEIRGQIEE